MDEFIRKMHPEGEDANFRLVVSSNRLNLIADSKYLLGFNEEEKIDDQIQKKRDPVSGISL